MLGWARHLRDICTLTWVAFKCWCEQGIAASAQTRSRCGIMCKSAVQDIVDAATPPNTSMQTDALASQAGILFALHFFSSAGGAAPPVLGKPMKILNES